MRFGKILGSMTREGETFCATVEDTWLQGRSLFGGIQGAIALRAMRSLLPPDLPLRVLQMTFVAPVPAGEVRVRAQVLRTGRSATQVEARIVSSDATAAVILGVFGSSRPSKVRVVPEPPPLDAPSPVEVPFIPGLSPAFLQHFQTHWLEGDPPFSGSTRRRIVVGVGMRGEDGPATEEHLLAIADVPPPVALSLLTDRAPGSSMTWTLELLAESVASLPLQGYRLDAELLAGRDGYTSQSVMVWGPRGEPVAVSRQSMVVFG